VNFLLDKSPTWLFRASLRSLLGCFVVYGHGIISGNVLTPTDPQDLCPGIVLGNPVMHDSLFPLSNQCLARDGTRTELVPHLTNPLIFIFIALAVSFFALGMYRLAGAEHHNPRVDGDDHREPHRCPQSFRPPG
jgi:hypothetical protein